MAGLSSTGFLKKTLAEVKLEIEEALRTQLGEFINLLPGSVFSQVVGIVAERESLIWDLAEEVYNSQYPDTAEGVALDNVVSLTGTERIAARKSRILEQILFGTLGTLVPAGTIIDVPGNPDARFETDADVTLIAGTDEVQTITFSAVPDSGTFKLSHEGEETAVLPFNASAAAVQSALNALTGLSGVTVTGSFAGGFVVTFTGADGKQAQPLLVFSLNTLLNGVTPVTPTVTETTPGVPQASVSMTAEEFGPIPAFKNTLTNIVTPVTGLNSAKNLADAVVGRNVETDAELRLRREQELQKAGAGTVEAIRAKLLEVEGVTQAIVFENDTMILDIDGRPAKSFESFVQGGVDQDIADAIWLAKGAGIQTVGTETETVVDSMGLNRTIKFSRPTVVNIFISIEVTKDFSAPSNLATLVREALASYVNGLQIGQDVVVYPSLICQLDGIPGIVDVRIGINTTGSPPLTGSDDNIAIGVAEVAKVDDPLNDIAVTVI